MSFCSDCANNRNKSSVLAVATETVIKFHYTLRDLHNRGQLGEQRPYARNSVADCDPFGRTHIGAATFPLLARSELFHLHKEPVMSKSLCAKRAGKSKAYRFGYYYGRKFSRRVAFAGVEELRDAKREAENELIANWDYLFDSDATFPLLWPSVSSWLRSVLCQDAKPLPSREIPFWKRVFGDAFRVTILDDKRVMKGFAEGVLSTR